ncbi:thiosulfate/3-mercaptopyruvate sulfurtransferase [Actinomadura rupiterrae]|nr:sulfurtransferase [Actinomadura rupiterrae]MCP2335710.1 thiosulfate/3-mercaptopyruvate sulfurtransferase [Actinomadura rupiterrae]
MTNLPPALPNSGDDGQTGDVRPLIDVSTLERLLKRGGPAPVLLDVRWHLGGPPGLESYRKGHLPGAVFVDLDRDVAGPPGPGGRHPLPEAAAFEAAMRRAGVSADRPVIVYDDADSTAAARLWWTLRYFGHENVRVLDGGYRAWTTAGYPVATAAEANPAAASGKGQDSDAEPGSSAEPGRESVAAVPGDFRVRPGCLPVLDAAGAEALAKAGVLLDARASERFRGEVEPIDPVAGHIPGAVNAPTLGNVGVDGRFLPSELLRDRFAELGATDAVDVGAYCGSGVTAAHEILALHLAGIPAALYVGSWSAWVADPTNPVATGEA